jgi:Domain of Unknown Function with PDB structure (DUF3858)/Transglutaminase-like superfamily
MNINKLRVVLLMSLVFSICTVYGQDFENIQFGNISAKDFQITSPKFDTGASAIVIKDIGKSEYVGNESGFFSIRFKRFVRIKILNRNGFHAADFRIHLHNYRNGGIEKILEIKASTFNLENGTVREEPLDPKSIYTEQYDRYSEMTKFTMPALKEGSVFDITYTIESNYFSDPPSWTFQGNYPCLWSEYQATIPSVFHYNLRIIGNDSFDIKTSSSKKQSFTIRSGGNEMDRRSSIYSVLATSFQYRWVKKNVPVLEEQPYISSMDNYISRISFELVYYQQDETTEKEMLQANWKQVSTDMLQHENFGVEINQDNPWLEDALKGLTAGALNAEDEIRMIYSFVRDNFNCTDYGDKYIRSSLKEVYKRRSGNVGEINLLLVAMLRHHGLKADPAILSTRKNGVPTIDIPKLNEYDYLICVAHTLDKTYLLDAASPLNPFKQLPAYCYNEGARLINAEHPDFIPLSPDSIWESSLTNVVFANDENGISSGSVTTRYGIDKAFEIREEIKRSTLKDYFKKLETEVTDMRLSNPSFDSLNRPNDPLILHYDLDFKSLKDADILYFNPILRTDIRNPFVAANRTFPVEMTRKIDLTYVLSMEIPKGFKVDEIPKSARVKLSETKGSFEYLIQEAGGMIQMRMHLKLNAATFFPEEYNDLRDFFAYVVKKESEQIVFKRIN